MSCFGVSVYYLLHILILACLDCFSECFKEMTSVVDKEWTAVLSTYKHHSSTLTVDELCTATALRPSISEQMAVLEQLNRQLQIKYPFKYAFAMLTVSFIVTLVALATN